MADPERRSQSCEHLLILLHVLWDANSPFVGDELLPAMDIIKNEKIGLDNDRVEVKQIGVRGNAHRLSSLVLTFSGLVAVESVASNIGRWNSKY